jgi:hypothetical protein
MSDALDFMLAARRSEMHGLQALELTCELVAGVSQLVHALQRERGFSNMFLGSQDERYRQGLEELTQQSQLLEAQVREGFDRVDIHSACGAEKAHLFNRIAYVLHAFEGLPALRSRVRQQALTPLAATQAFTRPIGGLLAVVFDAADTAVDPQVTRCLVALFNFMQGKELAGQERATGVAGFAAGWLEVEQLDRLAYLQEAQQRCFDTFTEFSEQAPLEAWRALCDGELSREIGRLRQVAARTSRETPVASALGEVWFDLATRRIDAMKDIEDGMTRRLREVCHEKISQARSDLDNHRALLQRLGNLGEEVDHSAPRLFNVQATDLAAAPSDNLGSQLNRSVLDVLHSQTQRLQLLSDELESARRSLSERKLIERAKAALMAQHGLNDDEAYRMLQNAAMERCQRLADVAQTVLTYTGLLQGKQRGTTRT